MAFFLLAVAGFGYLIGQTGATTQLQLDGGLATALGPRTATVVMATPTVAMAIVTLVHRRSPAPARPRAHH